MGASDKVCLVVLLAELDSFWLAEKRIAER
jgi:hypothetical protein